MNDAALSGACGSANFDAAVAARRSVRGFRPEPVPRELLEHVFALAARAPSNCNTQPWQVVLASGASCERLRARLGADFAAGRLSLDFPYDGRYEGVYRERQHDAAARLYSAMGIAREDKPARAAALLRNFAFYDAPHAAFVFMPAWCGIREAADVGMYAQTLMLALAAHGVASCPQTALGFAADAVREEFGLAVELKLLFGISIGYEQREAPANQCRIPRAGLAQSVRFVD